MQGINGITWEITDGIATITLAMDGRANKVNGAFGAGLLAALEGVLADGSAVGILIATGHKDFCVGADLDVLYAETSPTALYAGVRELGQLYRKLETCGLPVVAALTGSALGGGYELALACHHRIALNDPRVQLGLPEVNLGVIPGAGGTQRLPRLIGIQPALELMAQGKIVRAPKAKSQGLVDDLADSPEELRQKAIAWLRANRHARQPWDRGEAPPGFHPSSPEARQVFIAACAMLYKKTAGAFKAPEELVAVVQDGLRLSFDRGMEVEARAFARIATSAQAKDMIRSLWFFRTAAEKHAGLPTAASDGIHKVTILGAGMMGAGLAYVCAAAGYQVVLKDIRADALEKGMAHLQAQVAERQRHLSAEARAELLARVTGTIEDGPVAGSDLVIEAVVEDLGVKHKVIRQIEPLLAPGAIFASNTSALPITDLAQASAAPDRFIGLHFFSPVEQMPLLEVIQGYGAGEVTVGRALAFCRRIQKLPIVVNDGYAFYTTRVFSAYILEGASLVAEGHDPVLVEYGARMAGMVVPPLQVFDEVTLRLAAHAFAQGKAYRGEIELPGVTLVESLVKAGRTGRADGAGFYAYTDGKRTGLWPGLAALVSAPRQQSTAAELGRRLILAQVAEVGRAIDDGVLRRHQDAEVGAVFGIGFAPSTGGPLAWVDRQGVAAVVAELNALSAAHGPRYTPPRCFVKMAEEGGSFWGQWRG